MKKIIVLCFSMFAAVTLFTSCEEKQPTTNSMPPSFFAEVSALVVNEQGEPIPNVELWYDQQLYAETFREIPFSDYESYRKIYTMGTGLRTDENGKLVFGALGPRGATKLTEYLISCFFDTDGEENGSYEPLFITDPIRLDFIWNGKQFDGTTHILFEPIDLGTFVMHEKK